MGHQLMQRLNVLRQRPGGAALALPHKPVQRQTRQLGGQLAAQPMTQTRVEQMSQVQRQRLGEQPQRQATGGDAKPEGIGRRIGVHQPGNRQPGKQRTDAGQRLQRQRGIQHDAKRTRQRPQVTKHEILHGKGTYCSQKRRTSSSVKAFAGETFSFDCVANAF